MNNISTILTTNNDDISTIDNEKLINLKNNRFKMKFKLNINLLYKIISKIINKFISIFI